MKFIIIILASASVFFLVLGLMIYLQRSHVKETLHKLEHQEKLRDKLRILTISLGEYLQRKSLLREILNFEVLGTKLRLAGFKMNTSEFLGLWVSSMVGALIFTVLAKEYFPLFIIPFIITIGVVFPRAYLEKRYRKKYILFKRQFVSFAEKVKVGLSGGVSIYRVLQWASKSNTIIAGEVKRIIDDINFGTSLSDALDSFSRRMNDEEVDKFVEVIKNAERNGYSYENALSKLIEDLRRKRESKIDEVAKKAELKLIVPVVLTVLPATGLLIAAPWLVLIFNIIS